MAGELSRVRAAFVENVSLPVLKQLLDDLRTDRVLNEEEADVVEQQYSTRADKARCLVDMVRRKGQKPSTIMIRRLKERDENLCDHLGLSGANCFSVPVISAAPQAPSNPASQQDPNTLIHCSAAFRDQKIQQEDVYPPLDKLVRTRLALLINNVEFNRADLLRKGAEKDEEKMEALLKALGYEVLKYRNCSGQDIDNAVKEYSQREEHFKSDSAFVVIMSHGKRDAILGVHWDIGNDDNFPIDNIYKHLSTDRCPGLLNKPKVILIQACRGDEQGSVWVSDGIPEHRNIEDDSHREHKEKDFISLLSCTPDKKSYRHVEHGTFFVKWLTEVFNQHAHEDHVEELFRKVMKRFENFKVQMVCKDRTTLLKHFYLFPGF
ncbi:caspase-1-like [Denticeps clupeoides]|uniref:caspase-1-like n=1 Tax=Denticeps clupeoides TaxID=299321 RepID=UPI0010A536D3|nr:caspase-1-like [Denticeps clupeoides]